MQVKKFEAPTIQEALENVKRELGPEAIILQTKKNKRGFGLLSKSSVEVTAAVSDRALEKKQKIETRIPDTNKDVLRKLPAERQANLIDKYFNSSVEKGGPIQEKVALSAQSKKITATRYIDIPDDGKEKASPPRAQLTPPQASVRNPSSTSTSATSGTSSKSGNAVPMAVSETAVSIPAVTSSGRTSLEDELKSLRTMLEDLKKEKDSGISEQTINSSFQTHLSSPLLQEAFELMTVNGIERRLAYVLIKKAAFELSTEGARNFDLVLDALAQEIMKTVEVYNPLAQIKRSSSKSSKSPTLMALVGPTGVGKTMTLAKLANEATSNRSLRVGLVNLDQSKASSFAELGTYAKILNMPFRSTSSIEDFRVALMDFQNLDLVLIDTQGCSQKDPKAIKSIQESLKAIPDIQVHLVLSATTRDSELYDMAARFSSCGPRGLIISKLDESTIYGSIYNVSQRVKLPLNYFTTGQKIPEDIEDATGERLTALLLDI